MMGTQVRVNAHITPSSFANAHVAADGQTVFVMVAPGVVVYGRPVDVDRVLVQALRESRCLTLTEARS